MNKVILITGSNRGIGFEIARQCGRMGFKIIISGRNETRLKEALTRLRKENIMADSLLMDVGDPESIKTATDLFSLKNLKIDILVNNAAIIVKGDKGLVTNDVISLEKTLKTNSYGPLIVTKQFLRFMRSPGKIIMVSSTGGAMSRPVGGWSPAYCVSKTLLNAISRQLAYELNGRKISVNAVCPGWVRTEMGGIFATRSVEKGAETPVWLANEVPYEITGKFFRDKTEIPW